MLSQNLTYESNIRPFHFHLFLFTFIFNSSTISLF